MKENNINHIKENIFKKILLLCAFTSILAVIAITFFILISGVPAFKKIGFINFIVGDTWKPNKEIFGILPMIISSLLATIGAIVIGVPTGVFTAIYISKLASKKIIRILEQLIQLLAGIPSVIYGFFGLVVIVPIVKNSFNLPMGQSLFSAIIILSIMILPTVISISTTAINAVSQSISEASLALGATKIQTIFKAVIPAAKSGILSAIILGIGRAVGETMAVIMVAGNSPYMPTEIFSSIRTLTSNIAIEMGYAANLHRESLFATGIILFTFIMILNFTLMFVTKKGVNNYD